MLLLVIAILIGAGGFAAASEPVELTPGLWSMQQLEFSGRMITTGMTADQVRGSLGTKWKYGKKPKRTTAAKIAAQNADLARLWHFQSSIAHVLNEATAKGCRDGCWLAILQSRLAPKWEARVLLIGPEKGSLKAAAILVDYDHQAIKQWRSQTVADAVEGAFYVEAPSGHWRVSFIGNTIRIEQTSP